MKRRQNEKEIATTKILKNLEDDLHQRVGAFHQMISDTLKKEPEENSLKQVYASLWDFFEKFYNKLRLNTAVTDELIEKEFDKISTDLSFIYLLRNYSKPNQNFVNVVLALFKKFAQQRNYLLQAQVVCQLKIEEEQKFSSVANSVMCHIARYREYVTNFENIYDKYHYDSACPQNSSQPFADLSKTIENENLENAPKLLQAFVHNAEPIKTKYYEYYKLLIDKKILLEKDILKLNERINQYEKNYQELNSHIEKNKFDRDQNDFTEEKIKLNIKIKKEISRLLQIKSEMVPFYQDLEEELRSLSCHNDHDLEKAKCNDKYRALSEKKNATGKAISNINQCIQDYKEKYNKAHSEIEKAQIYKSTIGKELSEKIYQLRKLHLKIQRRKQSSQQKKKELKKILENLIQHEPFLELPPDLSEIDLQQYNEPLQRIYHYHQTLNKDFNHATERANGFIRKINETYNKQSKLADIENNLISLYQKIERKQDEIERISPYIKKTYRNAPITRWGKVVAFFKSLFKIRSLIYFPNVLISKIKNKQKKMSHEDKVTRYNYNFTISVNEINYAHEKRLLDWEQKRDSLAYGYLKLRQTALENIRKMEQKFHVEELKATNKKCVDIKNNVKEIIKSVEKKLASPPLIETKQSGPSLNELSLDQKPKNLSGLEDLEKKVETHIQITHHLSQSEVRRQQENYFGTRKKEDEFMSGSRKRYPNLQSIVKDKLAALLNDRVRLARHANRPLFQHILVDLEKLVKKGLTPDVISQNELNYRKLYENYINFIAKFENRDSNSFFSFIKPKIELRTLSDFERDVTEIALNKCHIAPNTINGFKKQIRAGVITCQDILKKYHVTPSMVANEIGALLNLDCYAHLQMKDFNSHAYLFDYFPGILKHEEPPILSQNPIISEDTYKNNYRKISSF